MLVPPMSKQDSDVAGAPLVSVTIPTYNEEDSLPFALSSVIEQTYPSVEVIVVDSYSRDKTRDIALEFGAKVIDYAGKLLGARFTGFRASGANFILFLDADQILEKDTIARAMEAISAHDMLILEEGSYEPRTYLQKKLEQERRYTHLSADPSDPTKSGLLPRFFRRAILSQIFDAIPPRLIPIVLADDHLIITYEARKMSANIGILPEAVAHIEPASIYEVLRHNYRFGKSSKALYKTGLYREVTAKRAFQMQNFGSSLKTGTTTIAFLRSVAYKLGYYLG